METSTRMTKTGKTDASERGVTGPANVFFRPKHHPPVSLTMTKHGKSILAAASKRTKRSRSDVVEQLLRQGGATVTFE